MFGVAVEKLGYAKNEKDNNMLKKQQEHYFFVFLPLYRRECKIKKIA